MNRFSQMLIRMECKGKYTLVAFLLLLCSFQSSNELGESTIKAMFLYNFTKHIEWPDSGSTTDFTIGIFGAPEIQKELQRITQNKKVNGRSIKVKEVLEIAEASDCHILFLSHDAFSNSGKEIEMLLGKPILLVTEEKKMQACCINIIQKDDKLRFELNEAAMIKARLKASQQLIGLAINTK